MGVVILAITSVLVTAAKVFVAGLCRVLANNLLCVASVLMARWKLKKDRGIGDRPHGRVPGMHKRPRLKGARGRVEPPCHETQGEDDS